MAASIRLDACTLLERYTTLAIPEGGYVLLGYILGAPVPGKVLSVFITWEEMQ
jgi:hypothetical protein